MLDDKNDVRMRKKNNNNNIIKIKTRKQKS